MNHPIYSMSHWLIFFCCCIWHTCNCFSFLLNRMFAFMLHSEYTTSCFMAKSVIWHDFQGSSHKQAGQTFHCFVLTVIFFNRLNENMFFLFVSSIFYSLRFRHFGWRFRLRTVDLSRQSRVLPPTQQFLRTRIKIIFRGRCQPRKLKSAKNKLHVFRQNCENLATRKYPIIRYALLFLHLWHIVHLIFLLMAWWY